MAGGSDFNAAGEMFGVPALAGVNSPVLINIA
jgi:hypothetical protein